MPATNKTRLEALERQAEGKMRTKPASADEPETEEDRIKLLREWFSIGALSMFPDHVTYNPAAGGYTTSTGPELADYLTRMMGEHPTWLLVLLTGEERRQALAALDSGAIRMGYWLRGGTVKENFHPECDWTLPHKERDQAGTLARALDVACRVASAQTGEPLTYDVTGELADVREWLLEFERIEASAESA